MTAGNAVSPSGMTNPDAPPTIRQFDGVQSLIDFVGQPALVSSAVVIDQEMIDRFAQVTRDSQWIHVDRARAAVQSPYECTIAHGFLLLSMLTYWQTRCVAFPRASMVLNYGFDKVRFTAPVRSGSRVTARFALAHAAETRPDQVRCSWDVALVVEDTPQPSVHAEWLMMVRYEGVGA